MATCREGTFRNDRSLELYYRAWSPPDRPRACIIFHHGYGSHCAAYDTEFKKIADAGIALFMFDAAGFGRSEPKAAKLRSYIEKWEHLVDDVYTFRKDIVEPALQSEPPLPMYMAGLSMGGLTTILCVLRDSSSWQGMILLSPAVDCPRGIQLTVMSILQSILVKIVPFARLVPQPQVPNVTLNEEERKKLATDEFFDPLKIRVQTGAMFLRAWERIAKHEHEITIPILIHYSSIDKVVYPPATERFARNVQSKDVTIKPFEYAHDIYLDVSKEESCALLIEWVLQHAANSSRAVGSQSDPAAENPARL